MQNTFSTTYVALLMRYGSDIHRLSKSLETQYSCGLFKEVHGNAVQLFDV